uniref:Putative secreted protein n=1 Tax=Ixodes ricinus TaxID=34613 RepID=A0A6B0VCC0_IXORI
MPPRILLACLGHVLKAGAQALGPTLCSDLDIGLWFLVRGLGLLDLRERVCGLVLLVLLDAELPTKAFLHVHLGRVRLWLGHLLPAQGALVLPVRLDPVLAAKALGVVLLGLVLLQLLHVVPSQGGGVLPVALDPKLTAETVRIVRLRRVLLRLLVKLPSHRRLVLQFLLHTKLAAKASTVIFLRSVFLQRLVIFPTNGRLVLPVLLDPELATEALDRVRLGGVLVEGHQVVVANSRLVHAVVLNTKLSPVAKGSLRLLLQNLLLVCSVILGHLLPQFLYVDSIGNMARTFHSLGAPSLFFLRHVIHEIRVGFPVVISLARLGLEAEIAGHSRFPSRHSRSRFRFSSATDAQYRSSEHETFFVSLLAGLDERPAIMRHSRHTFRRFSDAPAFPMFTFDVPLDPPNTPTTEQQQLEKSV